MRSAPSVSSLRPGGASTHRTRRPSRSEEIQPSEAGRAVALYAIYVLAFVIGDQSGKELAIQKIPYGAQLHVDDGDEVKRGARVAKGDPYMRPVLTDLPDATWRSEDVLDSTG